jgi:hypothetical protein
MKPMTRSEDTLPSWGGRQPARARVRLAGSLCLLLVLLAAQLSGCAPDARSAAQQNKAKLDSALQKARSSVGIPDALLKPIETQEQSLAAGTANGSDTTYQNAANGYATLYDQVVALEGLTKDQVQARATSDLQTLTKDVQQAQAVQQVASEVAPFAQNLQQARQQLAAATTTKDFFAADGYILDQDAAVTQIVPISQQLQALDKLASAQSAALQPGSGQPHVLKCGQEGGENAAFGPTIPAQFWTKQSDYPVSAANPIMVTPQAQTQDFYFSSWPAQDQTAFQAAQTANDFAVLGVQIQAQIAQLTADAKPDALAQAQAAAVVARFQSDVNTYQNDANADNSYLAAQRKAHGDVPDYVSVWNQSNSTGPDGGFGPGQDFFPNVPDFKVDGTYAQQVAQDTQQLSSAQTSGDYASLEKKIQQQEQALAFPLLRVKAYYDTNITLVSLIQQGQAQSIIDLDPYGTWHNKAFPAAYEYADDQFSGAAWNYYDPGLGHYGRRENAKDTVAIEDAQVRFDQAAYREMVWHVSQDDARADYQAVEDEAQMFIHNLSAMLTDLAQMPKDDNARKAWSMQVHQTDLDLLNYYGLQHARVIVVSLAEEKARLFENGKLVVDGNGLPEAFDVTTGAPTKPSVPGIHCLMSKKSPDVFKSPDPPGSPYYYNPTPVSFSFGYSLYGYFVHDGWWRDCGIIHPNGSENCIGGMGYRTNLPHLDPIAFNGGSHGCLNFHLVDYEHGQRHDMQIVYNFAEVGTPVIVY